MNIDGATAVIFSELGFAPALGRGIFILSRSVGILAHAWEQTQQGGRIKGPMSPEIPYRYTGPATRDLDASPAPRTCTDHSIMKQLISQAARQATSKVAASSTCSACAATPTSPSSRR